MVGWSVDRFIGVLVCVWVGLLVCLFVGRFLCLRGLLRANVFEDWCSHGRARVLSRLFQILFERATCVFYWACSVGRLSLVIGRYLLFIVY